MGRRKITDGSKITYAQMPITEKNLEKIGKPALEKEWQKMVKKMLYNLEKGISHNQINLIDSIAEIEKQTTK